LILAKLGEVELNEADLSEADLSGVKNLCKAKNLDKAILTQEQEDYIAKLCKK